MQKQEGQVASCALSCAVLQLARVSSGWGSRCFQIGFRAFQVHENAVHAGAESSVRDLLARVARFWPVASYASSRFSDARKRAFAAAPNAPSDKEALVKEIEAFHAEEEQRKEDWRQRQRAEQHASVVKEHQNAVQLEMDRIGLKRKADAGERLKNERQLLQPKLSISQQWIAASKEGIRLDLERKANDAKRKAAIEERSKVA